MKLSKDTAHRLLSIGLALGVLTGCDQALPLPTTAINPTETVDAINATLHAQATAFAQSPTLEPAAEATYWADRNRESEYYAATVAAGRPTRTLSPDSADIATAKANGTLLTPFLSPVPRVIGRHYGCFDIPNRTITVHDCWFMVDNLSRYELVLYTKDADPSVSYILVETQTIQTQDVTTARYGTPRTIEPLYIHHTDGAQIYFATFANTTTVVLRFNLETRQWLDPNGTPIPVTATPTSIMPVPATPTSGGSTSTPRSAKTALLVVGTVTNTNVQRGFSRHKPH